MHRSFGAVRAAATREPVTFDFGLYGEETFTVVPDPTLGDTFDLYDAPEPASKNDLEAARTCARFIQRMLPPEERARFDLALHRIPSSECHIIIDCAAWIAEQVTTFPTVPPTISSRGRQRNGSTSRAKPGGGARSKR